MALEMRQITIHFDTTSGRKQREEATAVFSARVEKAEAMLKGFNLRYANGDHHVLEQEIDLDITQVNNNTVTVAADFLLRDGSGNIDDPYRGFVQAVVIADTAASPADLNGRGRRVAGPIGLATRRSTRTAYRAGPQGWTSTVRWARPTPASLAL